MAYVCPFMASSIPGWAARTARVSSGSVSWLDAPAKPMVTRPYSPRPAALAARTAVSRSSSTVRTGSRKDSPALVSRTERVLRSKSWTPSSFSSWRICWLSGGWAICSRLAARPKWSSSATAVNAVR